MLCRQGIFALLAACSTVVVGSTAADAFGLGQCYVRADVGYAWSVLDGATAQISPGFGTATGPVQDGDLRNAWFGEVGLGCGLMRASPLVGSIKDQPTVISTPLGLRADVTFGFHGAREFHGTPINPPLPPPAFVDPASAKLRTSTLMFNGYFDFGTFHVFTPYIGAGIGAAFLDLDDVTFTNGTTVRLGSANQTNLAWSLMVGVSTDLGRGIKLDVGYRYLHLGDIGLTNAALGYALRLDDVSEQQLRVGVRVPLWLSR